jgi:biopolymer transport protein ExbB
MDVLMNFCTEFFKIWTSGGILMWPLLLIAILIYWLVFDMFSRLSKNNMPDNILLFDKDNLPPKVSNIINDILEDNPAPRVMRNRVLAMKAEYLPNIKGRLNILTIFAGVSPLLGLLGTVMGMLNTFSQMNRVSVQTSDLMAGGISEALITTQMGLIIAVPALIMIMILKGKRDKLSQFFQKLESVCYYNLVSQPTDKAA